MLQLLGAHVAVLAPVTARSSGLKQVAHGPVLMTMHHVLAVASAEGLVAQRMARETGGMVQALKQHLASDIEAAVHREAASAAALLGARRNAPRCAPLLPPPLLLHGRDAGGWGLRGCWACVAQARSSRRGRRRRAATRRAQRCPSLCGSQGEPPAAQRPSTTTSRSMLDACISRGKVQGVAGMGQRAG